MLVVSDLVIEIAMLGPRGTELGPRQVVAITTETATMWQAINVLGEFDRITLVGSDVHALAARVAHQSQRPMRQMSVGALRWTDVVAGRGVELAVALSPRLQSTLYHDGTEVPGLDVGAIVTRKRRRYRDYIAPSVCERKGPRVWLRRVSRVVDEILAVWNPTTLYLAAPPTLPMPDTLPWQVEVIRLRETLEDALGVWNTLTADDARLVRTQHGQSSSAG